MATARVVLGLATLAATLPADAARPMVTDDARIVDAKACQVESWVRRNRDSTEMWALPACNPWGPVELTMGGAFTREGGDTRFTDHQVQAKTLIRPYEPGGWGIGFAAGTVRHPAREQARGWPGDVYAYIPASVSAAADDAVVLHFNVGAVHRRDERRTVSTAGIGMEARVSPVAYFIPEVFLSDRGRPCYQAGLRYWLVPDRLQVDATFGNRLVSDSRDRWFSIGLRVLSPPFLP